MRHSMLAALLLGLFGVMLTGCTATPPTEEKREKLASNARETLDRMRADSPEFGRFLDEKAYAYAVFPNVGEGAFIIGAGAGRGEVFEKGRMIGYSLYTKLNIGPQIGGQALSQVIAFEDSAALHKFIDREYAFTAEAKATAIKSGVALNARFQDGVAVFQHTKGGLIAAVAVGGQRFKFAPKPDDR
jgi:lipid-binding SYLF domain-containing protein